MELQTILVILLSVGLLMLLVVSITFVTILIGMLKTAQRIAAKAELSASNWAGMAKLAGKRLGPTAVVGLLATLIKAWGKRSRKG